MAGDGKGEVGVDRGMKYCEYVANNPYMFWGIHIHTAYTVSVMDTVTIDY